MIIYNLFLKEWFFVANYSQKMEQFIFIATGGVPIISEQFWMKYLDPKIVIIKLAGNVHMLREIQGRAPFISVALLMQY